MLRGKLTLLEVELDAWLQLHGLLGGPAGPDDLPVHRLCAANPPFRQVLSSGKAHHDAPGQLFVRERATG